MGLRRRSRRRRRCAISCRRSGLHAFGLDGHPAAICAAGALVEYLRDTQKVDLAHVRAIGWRERQRRPADRSDDVPAPRVLEGADGGREGSLLSVHRSHPDGRWARACCAAWLMRPLVALERIQDRLDAVEEFAFRADRARPAARHAARRPRSRAPGRRASRSAPPARAISSRCASRWPRSRASAWSLERCAGAARPEPGRRAGRSRRPPRRAGLGAGRRAAGAGPRRRRHPRRRRRRARRPARHQPLRPRAHRGDGGGRARRAPASAR